MRWAVFVAATAVACGSGAVAEDESPSPRRRPQLTNPALTDPSAGCVTGRSTVTAECVMPLEEDDVEIVDAAASTADGCTHLYVASRVLAVSTVARLRRYRMTGVTPCGFARDTSFPEVTSHVSAIAATRDGAVYALGHRAVRRLAPGPIAECRSRGVTLGNPSVLALSEDGATGYVVWNRSSAPRFGRLVLSADACAIEPFDVPELSPMIWSIAVDPLHRLHVHQRLFDASSAGSRISFRTSIIDPEGRVVREYAEPAAGRLLSCGDRMCGRGGSRFTTYDADGAVLGHGSDGFRDVGDGASPLFEVGRGGSWISILGMQ